jgi:hypothetical protein
MPDMQAGASEAMTKLADSFSSLPRSNAKVQQGKRRQEDKSVEEASSNPAEYHSAGRYG